jgi:hypothetical protein
MENLMRLGETFRILHEKRKVRKQKTAQHYCVSVPRSAEQVMWCGSMSAYEPYSACIAFGRAVVTAGVDACYPRRKDWEVREPMTDLIAHLEALVRRYAAECDLQPPSAGLDGLGEDFCEEVDLLIAKYGQAAVDKAIDAMPDAAWPSVSLH